MVRRLCRDLDPPAVSQPDWVRTPVDAFILAQLDANGLKPSPRADVRTLVRRAYFDLIGLPPTPEQIEAFEREPPQDAWVRLIDQLLASPQYGERWGRHWLDVARYADSGGFETDVYYRNAWRYRDYVVKSFNDDKPYDVFVQEQIAGDELWPDDITLNGNYTIAPEKVRHLEAWTGTGLYTLGPQVHESNMDGRKIRYETWSDWVDTTGAAFMGLTFSCARCHDHKFDPITQQDYYAMQAIFSGSREIEYPIIDAMGITDFKQHYPRILAVEESRRALRMFDARMAGKALAPEEQTERQNLLNAIANNVLALPENTALGVPLVGLMETPTVSVLGHERPELITPVLLLNRGELSRPRDAVAPGLPEALKQASDWQEPMPGHLKNRAALAHWLTSPKHPLTARVMVNRIWHGHFGRGLVGSLNDFGQMGERPTHPELLDWLAGEFMKSGWSIKQMHRTMMLSSTYQMHSVATSEENASIDPRNRHFWKMNRRRLEAEVLWDSIHSVAGTLNLKMGGRPVVFIHTGFSLAGYPSAGAWVNYGLGSENDNLPGYVVLASGGSPLGGIGIYGNGFLPAVHQASLIDPSQTEPLANIAPREAAGRQRNRLRFVERVDRRQLEQSGHSDQIESAIRNYETAFRMQTAVPALVDLTEETEAPRRLYGMDSPVKETAAYGQQCLLARRLVERGVRFVELTCLPRPTDLGQIGNPWDQHGGLKAGHAEMAQQVDQPIAGLIRDLKQRGRFEETLIVWAGEFGRTPFAQGSDGRDHNLFGFSVWLAGGGIKGGTTYGATDDLGYHAVENVTTVYDLWATVLHVLGVDHEALTYRFGGRDFRLTDVHGNVIRGILA